MPIITIGRTPKPEKKWIYSDKYDGYDWTMQGVDVMAHPFISSSHLDGLKTASSEEVHRILSNLTNLDLCLQNR